MSWGDKQDRSVKISERRRGSANRGKERSLFPIPLYILGLILLYAVSAYLFYKQTLKPGGRYPSDTSVYVRISKEKHGVRLITWIYNYLYNLRGDTLYIALYMAAVVVLTVIVNYFVIKWYLDRAKGQLRQGAAASGGSSWTFSGMEEFDLARDAARLASFVMLFTGSMYLPVLHARFYRKSWCTYAWHSPTQQLMILFAMISLLLFLKMYDTYMDYINPFMWIGLMITSVMSVWAKPSFMLVFIPTLIIVFLIELAVHVKDGMTLKRFRRLFLFGLSMVPTGFLILFLNSSIYGEGSKNKVAMSLVREGGFGYNVYAAAFCGLLFPALVFLFNLKKFRELPYQIAAGMLTFGIAEWALFQEVGTRAKDGNFAWGRQFGCYYVFLCAICVWIDNFRDESFMGGRKWLKNIYLIITGIILAIHVLSQMVHFYLMLRGYTYYK